MNTDCVYAPTANPYRVKEVGPIVIALAFVIAVGGMTTAAVILCGWHGTQSMGVNWSLRRVEILCR